jgi:RHS repeat-associated protein
MGHHRVWFCGNAPWNPHEFGFSIRSRSLAFNLRFPGQYYDAETGLHYNYFRDYDASIGRYIQSDPIGPLDGVNTFGYVSANPLASVDLLGLAECTYSIGRHTLSCKPNPGSGGDGRSVNIGPDSLLSGTGTCRDNPSQKCQDSKDHGPIPEGDYDILPYDGNQSNSHNWWRLRPQSITRRAMDGLGFGRGGHLLHPGRISLGCITYTNRDRGPYDRLDELLRRDQPSTLKVTP